ncbi:hypothetical protein TRVA0_024S01794 [Trichomonascus vanleenenianus]|uniref:uncharacterized protein n=1 Tax=Trichomonascus vanleenenianus TaxID=2268995 RepID=UPI003ECB2879
MTSKVPWSLDAFLTAHSSSLISCIAMPVTLPPEILEITFGSLDPFSLLSVAHTCMQWREIVRSIDSQFKSQDAPLDILEDNTLLFDSLGPNFNVQFKSALVLQNITRKSPLKVSQIRHDVPIIKTNDPLPQWFGESHVEIDQSPSSIINEQSISQGYIEFIDSELPTQAIQVKVRNMSHELIAAGSLHGISDRTHVQSTFVARSMLFVNTIGEKLKAYTLPDFTLLFTTTAASNQTPGSVIINDNYLCIPPCNDCPHFTAPNIRVLPLKSPDQWYTVASTSLSRFYSASFKNITTVSPRYICVTMSRGDSRWFHYLVLVDLYKWTTSAYLVMDHYGKWCVNWNGKVVYVVS